MSRSKSSKSDAPEEVEKVVKDTKKFIDKAVGEIGWDAATRQLIFGSLSGWLTGFVAMRAGKVSGMGLGGGAMALHYAEQNGYINLNWDKVTKKVDKLTDKIEKEATGSSPAWIDKVERFVDRKLDKAEDAIKNKQLKAKKWYHSVAGDEYYRATETHVFLASFVAGLAMGLMCGR